MTEAGPLDLISDDDDRDSDDDTRLIPLPGVRKGEAIDNNCYQTLAAQPVHACNSVTWDFTHPASMLWLFTCCNVCTHDE